METAYVLRKFSVSLRKSREISLPFHREMWYHFKISVKRIGLAAILRQRI